MMVFKWLERLSLDAVLVAVVWGLALGGKGMGLIVLGLATWLTYVADRLWEVRPGKPVPQTDRHSYYKSNYTVFRTVWLVCMIVAVVLAYAVLPGWQFLGGWGLVVVIFAYLSGLSVVADPSRRLLMKRIIVPVVFTIGVVWMAQSWRSLETVAGSVVLLSAAMANLFLISYQENYDKLLPAWFGKVVGCNVLSVVLVANVALFAYWPAGVAGLFCAIAYFVLLVRIKTRTALNIRAWVDSMLAVAGLVLWSLS